MIVFYNIGIALYYFAIRLLAFLGNKKAKLWQNGRKTIFQKIEKEIQKAENLIWMHVSSLGEFEQGRPVIEALKKEQPHRKILLTFFSPSGYEVRKNYHKADYIFYLPLDTAKNANRFLDLVQPSLVIFVKYDFWYHFLSISFERKIPTILISALFRPSQIFFKSYGKWYKKILLGFQHIFVQNQSTFDLLKEQGIEAITLAGDNRVDRVWAIGQKPKDFSIVKTFSQNQKILVCGSTWQPDERLLFSFFEKYKNHLPFKIIIAPHQIHAANIDRILATCPISIVKYSEATLETIKDYKVLLIDNIGMLSSLYQYGKIAYIGGGFTQSIHNTLEPIAFGLPVVFGKKYQKFEEANWLVKHGGGFSVLNEVALENAFLELLNPNFYQNAAKQAKRYIDENRGATEKIIEWLVKEK